MPPVLLPRVLLVLRYHSLTVVSILSSFFLFDLLRRDYIKGDVPDVAGHLVILHLELQHECISAFRLHFIFILVLILLYVLTILASYDVSLQGYEAQIDRFAWGSGRKTYSHSPSLLVKLNGGRMRDFSLSQIPCLLDTVNHIVPFRRRYAKGPSLLKYSILVLACDTCYLYH